MDFTDLLPKFRHPPVEEVAIGIQFTTSGFLPTHYGVFQERVRPAFPGVQVLPPLPPLFEMAAGSSNAPELARIGLGGIQASFPLPRVLFISEDDCSLIQLQSDRLYFNWRRRPNNQYPTISMSGAASQTLTMRSKHSPLTTA